MIPNNTIFRAGFLHKRIKDDILPLLPNFPFWYPDKENSLWINWITQYELYDLNFKEVKQVLKSICCVNWAKCVSTRNIRFSSEGKDSAFVFYYQCEEQNKSIVIENDI